MSNIWSKSAAVISFKGFIANPPHVGPKAQYWAEFDNAFGLAEGGDLKIAGVRAGTVTDLELDKRTLHAKVGFRVTQNGFGSLRTDTTCETRPQSLIGEYFLDCDPGTAKKSLGNSSRWKEVFELNKDQLKGDPRRLKPGMTLKLPVS